MSFERSSSDSGVEQDGLRRPAGRRESTLPDDLLKAAAQLFRRNGYARTTTRELASALGIQKASLYHYIHTKEDLLYELCINSLDIITEEVRGAVEAVDPHRQLPALIEAHVHSILAHQDMHAVMLMELRALSPGRLTEVIARRDRYEALVKGILAEGQRAGTVRSDIEPGHLALALLNLLNWTIFWYKAKGPLAPTELSALLRTIYVDGVEAETSLLCS